MQDFLYEKCVQRIENYFRKGFDRNREWGRLSTPAVFANAYKESGPH